MVKFSVNLANLAVHEDAALLPVEDKMAILDEKFWDMISQCIQILQPVSEAIFPLESNQPNIQKVFTALKDMKSKIEFCLPDVSILEDSVKEEIIFNTSARIETCLKPIHYAAYLLDPASQGVELDDRQEEEAITYITRLGRTLDMDVYPNLVNYRAKDRFWSRRFVWQNLNDISALTWWKGVYGSTPLCKIAVRILTAPCTSAAVERSFSTQSNIHNKKRNRLTAERASKITFLSYNWNLLYKYIENPNENDVTYLQPTNSLQNPTIPQPSTFTNNDPQPSTSTENDPQPSTSTNHDFEFFSCDDF